MAKFKVGDIVYYRSYWYIDPMVIREVIGGCCDNKKATYRFWGTGGAYDIMERDLTSSKKEATKGVIAYHKGQIKEYEGQIKEHEKIMKR